MSDEHEIIHVRPSITPMELIDKALSSGMKPEELGKLMDLQERWEKNEAAKAYALAVTKFQSICNTVLKRRTATIRMKEDKGEYHYAFASFDDIMREVSPALTECSLAVTFNIEQVPDKPNILKVTCQVRHGIHVQETCSYVPIPAMTVNDTQKFGAAVTYGKRYVLCAALNIVTTDMDNDASGLIDNITDEHKAELLRLIAEKNANMKLFLEYAEVEVIEDISEKAYLKLVEMLRRKAVQK